MMLEQHRRNRRLLRLRWPLGLCALATGVEFAGCSSLLGGVELDAQSANLGLNPAGPVRAPDRANERCVPGSLECFDAARQVCSDIGTWSPVEICASAVLCTPDRCLRATCLAAELRCDGKELQACNDGRDGWSLVDTCRGPAQCDPTAGVCTNAPCQAGVRRCNASRYESCRADRSDWDLISACESLDLCNAALAQNSDTCAPPVCDPGQVRCDGLNLERCNAGRSGWDLVDRCSTEPLCAASVDAGKSSCQPAACAVGAFVCEGNELRSCNDGRTNFVDTAACLSSELCDPVRGRCGAPECEPAEQRCNGAQIEVCDAERTGFVTSDAAPCATAELCRTADGSASCASAVCDAGQFRCAGNLLQRCAEGRDAWVDFTACENADLCDPTRGALGCQAPACAAGEQRCADARVEQCSATRTGFVTAAECATAALCVQTGTTASCAEPACAAGETRCQNRDTLLTCNADQTGFNATDCDTGATDRCLDGPPAACRR